MEGELEGRRTEEVESYQGLGKRNGGDKGRGKERAGEVKAEGSQRFLSPTTRSLLLHVENQGRARQDLVQTCVEPKRYHKYDMHCKRYFAMSNVDQRTKRETITIDTRRLHLTGNLSSRIHDNYASICIYV